MLVLSRKAGEEIVIGDDVRITILALNNHGVRLGFSAPRDVRIHRQEVQVRIEREEEVTFTRPTR